MKNIAFIFVFLMLTACAGQEKGELTRVDFQKVDTEGSYEDVVMITDNESVELLKTVFDNIKWDDKVVNMARKPDVKASFFYTYDENMPERLVDYEFWFNKKAGTTTIISNNEHESYGELDKDYTDLLKSIFLSN